MKIPKSIIALLLVISGLVNPKVFASGDTDECLPPLTIDLRPTDICWGNKTGVYFFHPYNDTRINLLLLLEDEGFLQLDINDSKGDLAQKVPFTLGQLFNPEAKTDSNAPANAVNDLIAEKAKDLNVSDENIGRALQQLDVWLEGRCVSNDKAGILNILNVLAKSTLSNEEKSILATRRLQFSGLCEQSNYSDTGVSFSSADGKAFSAYFSAAAHFYRGEFGLAEALFAELKNSSNIWIKETSAYMLARVYLNQAQEKATDNWGLFENEAIDIQKLHQAESEFNAYIAAYPQGLYTDSAKGLFRKIYWLEGNGEKLGAAYVDLLGTKPKDGYALDEFMKYAEEIDNRYFFKLSANPKQASPLFENELDGKATALASISVLTRMRGALVEDNDTQFKPISMDMLKKQESSYKEKGREALYRYLTLATLYFVDKNYDAVVQATESLTPTTNLSNLDFSFFTLRGLALERKQDWKKALALWKALHAATQKPAQLAQLELAIAQNLERGGQLDEVFSANTLIKTAKLRQQLIEHSAPASLLEEIIKADHTSSKDKAYALVSLVHKLLIFGRYADLARILKSYPPEQYTDVRNLHAFAGQGQSVPDFICPAVINTVDTLVNHAENAESLLCLGELMRQDYDTYKEFPSVYKHQLGGIEASFNGNLLTPMDIYLKVMADTKASAESVAYALHRAINCYAPSAYNHCGSQDIDIGTRKKWFQTLKSRYKSTTWAQSQKYYW